MTLYIGVDIQLRQQAVSYFFTVGKLTFGILCKDSNYSELAKLMATQGYDIRTIQELLGYKDATTTMIYRHVLTEAARVSRVLSTCSEGTGSGF